jgi:hypothetical protein
MNCQNTMIQSSKYKRTLHARISRGTSSDDRFLPRGYVKIFAEMDDLIMTEKLDGQNNCFSKYGLFARSHAIPSELPWDKPLRERWQLIKNDLNDLEIFGENLYAIHSIGYKKPESFFYVFAIRENDRWLSWEEVRFYAAVFDFPTVPEFQLKVKLKDFFRDDLNEDALMSSWLNENLAMDWHAFLETSGHLEGYDVISGKPACEGFVIRNIHGFQNHDTILPVAANEFSHLMKIVRPGHVKTSEHWSKRWKITGLINYSKYNWHSYEF